MIDAKRCFCGRPRNDTLSQAIDLMGELKERGVRLGVSGDKLLVWEHSRATKDQMKRLVPLKPDVIALLNFAGEDFVIEIDPGPVRISLPVTEETLKLAGL